MTASGSTIIPCLRYRKAHVAIDWLCNAFGFERQAVYGDADVVQHAQLTLGTGMVMVSSVGAGGEWSSRMAQPDEIGERETQACSVVVADVDAHYRQAKAAGARIEIDIADQSYGGRGYACRDIEGHLWWFGSYDPWNPPDT